MLGTITLTVGQTDGVSVSQKEEAPGTMDIVQDEVAPQVNGEKEEKESPGANEISVAEEKAAEEKPDETNEVGFKKIFRFVGFKFTLKKDKSEEKDPVKLLNVKEKEGEEESKAEVTEDVPVKSEEPKEAETTETADTKAEVAEAVEESTVSESPAEDAAAEVAEAVEGEEGPKEEEAAAAAAETSPPSQEVTVSPFKKFFGGGLFSNLRKKASIKKPKEEEEGKAAEEETKEAEETGEVAGEEVEKAEVEEEAKEAEPTTTPEEAKPESTPETAAPEESKEEIVIETPVPAADGTDESAPVVEKAEEVVEGEKAPAEVANEVELLSSQEKVKAQGSPLKKLFTGAGLKKLSTKKHKSKKADAEAKLTESGEQVAEQLQSSSESAEAQKPDSAASSPEESGEHAVGVEAGPAEPSQEAEGEVTSDGEKKKEGIMPWSSFKKLVTPKKRVKRPSESEDEATGEKPVKSATLSSTESAASVDKCSDEEAKEDKATEEEPKTENAEKLESSSEEPKKKMDTSVSWEALMCMGGAKKRTRRTSDSDDEETKIEEEAVVATEAGEEQEAVEVPIVASQEVLEEVGESVASPEAGTSPPEKESTWDTLKRMVTRSKPKVEEKVEEAAEQVVSDSEVAKEETSSFSLRKLFPGRRKKKVEKQLSAELGSGEEDSDTPAVVPLSEYDVEPKEEAAVEVLQTSAEAPAVNQAQVSAEDTRSPSWIPAISVAEDEDDKQLSDIPEEAENVATPKSADTTIADVIGEQILSTAEVVVVPDLPAETSPVPEAPESETTKVVLETAVMQVSEIPCQTSVPVEDVPVEVASAETEHEPLLEEAESETKAILEPHVPDEATVICTGLETTEIAAVPLEEPVTATVECVAMVNEAVSTEVLVEEKALPAEDAIASQDTLLGAQVQQVETTELEPVLGDIECQVLPELQAAIEEQEPEIELATTVNALHDESELVQPSELSDNSPKVVLVDPIAPTVEAAVVTESVEVTETHVETKEKEMEFEQTTATEEIASLGEMVQVTVQEMASPLIDTAKDTVTEGTEPAMPANGNDIVEEVPEVLSAPLTEEEPRILPLKVQENHDISVEVAETVVDVVSMGAAESEVAVVLEQVNEKAQDEVTAENADAIEEQGMVIAKAVIQNAVDKVSEAQAEPEEPVQAVATIEKEIDAETEMPVVTETPVAVVVEAPAPEEPESTEILCHATVEVTCSVPVEVVESLDAPTEEEEKKEEEQKPAEEIRQAVEETISEEIVIEEVEVVEINTESLTNGTEEEVVNEEVKPVEEKEVAVVSEEVKAEAAPVEQEEKKEEEEEKEQEKESMPELHVPTQIILQVAQVVEYPTLEEESVVEFDSNGPVNDLAPANHVTEDLQTQAEEPQTDVSTEEAAPSQEVTEKATAKCAEVMAQVIEVIEEAVKEIEPISTDITAAS